MTTNGADPAEGAKNEDDKQAQGEQAAGGSPQQAAPADDAQKRFEEAARRADDNWEKFVRAQAEVENMRKRTVRDVEQARLYAIEKFVSEILAVKDSLELGLEKPDSNREKLYEGVALTLKLLNQIFEKFEIKEIVPQGEAFNPDEHQAMLTQADSGQAPGTVLEVVQKGYSLSGRLLRPALVNVADKADKANQDGSPR